ncbi:MAG: (Fe-S)-binding protein [Coriobacteriales bacterium]|jgi:Fe-S oxidoreductase|nr:(Fe-S)-binding protein [Coriobacteriales bacterium]
MTLRTTDNPQLLAYRVDRPDNLFAAMRRLRGYHYDDALEAPAARGDAAHTLFWPGCTLSAYSQELTLAVDDYLRQRGLASAMSVKCCSNILRYAADGETRLAFARLLALELRRCGVRRIIAACPNCYNSFRELIGTGDFSGLEVQALSTVLLEQGERIRAQDIGGTGQGTAGIEAMTPTVCVHDSCPDRPWGVFAESVRGLFEDAELREMQHHHSRALCCGIGKLLFIRKPAQSRELRQLRQAEFAATGAKLLVTSCVSCTNAFQNLPNARHYLELLFGIRIDWSAAVAAGEQAMLEIQASLEATPEHTPDAGSSLDAAPEPAPAPAPDAGSSLSADSMSNNGSSPELQPTPNEARA